HLPKFFAVGHPQTVQHPFDAEDVDPVVVHDGTTPRSVVVAVGVFVVGAVGKLPQSLAGLALQTIQGTLVAAAVEVKQPAAADGRHAVANADFLRPDDLQPLLGPG